MEALIAYVESNPLVGASMALLIGLFIGSLFKKLIKAALILGIVAIAAFYIVQERASEEWRTRADVILKKAEEAAKEYGHEYLEKGKEAIEGHLPPPP